MSSLSLLQTIHWGDDEDLAYPVVPIDDLCQIHGHQRGFFIAMVVVIFMIALVGNVAALYVNTRRKLRPFFRCCLISLALSDLLYALSFTTAYVAHFNAKYLELWTLGRFMCSFVPFVNTGTIMFSSLILVAIALDRYMAIRRAATGIWNPSPLFCGLTIIGIWLISVVTAAPLFIISDTIRVYLQPTEQLVVSELQLARMCLGMSVSYFHVHIRQGVIGIYNVTLLSFIFLPCIVGFVFLNATIARRLWQRRHQQQQQHQQPERGEAHFMYLLSKPETTYAMMTAFSVAAAFDLRADKLREAAPTTSPPPQTTTRRESQLSPAAAARVARHRRMVHVVILMMAAFICLRLPAWIFLILRLYGTFSTPVDWLLYFSFGLLNLASSALNPLFYTFLPQSIRILSLLKQKLQRCLCCGCCCVCCAAQTETETETEMPTEPRKLCLCFGSQLSWRCYPKAMATPAASEQRAAGSAEHIFVIHNNNNEDTNGNENEAFQATASMEANGS